MFVSPARFKFRQVRSARTRLTPARTDALSLARVSKVAACCKITPAVVVVVLVDTVACQSISTTLVFIISTLPLLPADGGVVMRLLMALHTVLLNT